MEALNQSLFLALNAPAGLGGASLTLAIGAAKYAVLGVGAIFAAMWLTRGDRDRSRLVLVALASVLALGLNYVIGLIHPHPRPFMIGMGNTYLPHAPESSFPSDHASVMWTLALGLVSWPAFRAVGWLAVALAALTSWARVFLGLHFPFDVLGSLVVALVALAGLAPLGPWVERAVAGVSAWPVPIGRRGRTPR